MSKQPRTRRPKDMRGIRERTGKYGETSFFVEVRKRGQTVRMSHPTYEDAVTWRNRQELAIEDGARLQTTQAKRRTLSDLLDKFLSDDEQQPAQATKAQLEWWRQELGQRRLSDISTTDFKEAKAKLLGTVTRTGKAMSVATANRYVAALSTLYSYGVAEDWLDRNPLIGKKLRSTEPRGRTRFLTTEERTKLLDACAASEEKLLLPLVTLAISTGARAGELLALRWQDLDLKQGRGVLLDTKNGDDRAMSVKGKALELLVALEKDRRPDVELVFPAPNGIKPLDYHAAFKAAVTAAGISDFRFHDLRHSCASYLAMNGASLLEIAAVLGHKTLAMVKRYSHHSDTHVAGVVSRMNEKIFGAPPKAVEQAPTTET